MKTILQMRVNSWGQWKDLNFSKPAVRWEFRLNPFLTGIDDQVCMNLNLFNNVTSTWSTPVQKYHDFQLPKQGRMLAVDNFVQSPYSSQGYNRYSYVQNSPLSFVDPTGELLIGSYLIAAYEAKSWDPFGWGKGEKFDGTIVVGVSSDGVGVNVYGGGSLSSGSPNWVVGGNTQTGNVGGGVSSFGLPSYTQAPSAASFSIDWGGVRSAQYWENDAGHLSFSNAPDGSILTSGNAQTLTLLGIGLSADWAQRGAAIFQNQNLAIQDAALSRGIPTGRIQGIIQRTESFATRMKWLGRGVVVYGALVSSYDGLSAILDDDIIGAQKAGIDLGVGLGSAAIGGLAGVAVYGLYMSISSPPPLPYSQGYRPDQSIFYMDNTLVAPPTIIGEY